MSPALRPGGPGHAPQQVPSGQRLLGAFLWWQVRRSGSRGRSRRRAGLILLAPALAATLLAPLWQLEVGLGGRWGRSHPTQRSYAETTADSGGARAPHRPSSTNK